MSGQRSGNFASLIPGEYFNIWNEVTPAGTDTLTTLIPAVTIEKPDRLVVYEVDIEGAKNSAFIDSIVQLELSEDGGSSFSVIRKWNLNHFQELQPTFSRSYRIESPLLDVYGFQNDAGAEQVQVRVSVTQTTDTARVSAGFTGRLIAGASCGDDC